MQRRVRRIAHHDKAEQAAEQVSCLACSLRAGAEVSDTDFDRIYPMWIRQLSAPHWTPIDVARRAAALLAVTPDATVLDVGAGAGKFCIIGALTTRATFVGVEQRGNLVDIAQVAARACDAARTRFIHENILTLDWTGFDGFYLFNPFYEHIASWLPHMEGAADFSCAHFTSYVGATYQKLAAARVGTRVVTYHGYGGPMPPSYRLLLHEPAGTDFLDVWEREADAP